MKIKTGDKVRVLAGKDRGKTGKVLKAFPKKDLVVVEGIGMVKKHQRPRKSNEKGQILEIPGPVHVSNVALEKDTKKGK